MQSVKKGRGGRRGGFTLIEVLLVIAIIALLAAFVVPSFMNVESSARVDVTESMVEDGGALATALKLYRMSMGTYPEELSALVNEPEDEEEAAKWDGPYIEDVDKLKDAWQNELNYRYPGEVNENGYDLWSNGPDGEEGTDDDIGNWKKEE